ncbi:hypothetical protein BZA77DRAFT_325974 [Pyronema omphalodes]|nr:hypothetical protein BZA77DRAFT_325974 [Pyronema omphalodes]
MVCDLLLACLCCYGAVVLCCCDAMDVCTCGFFTWLRLCFALLRCCSAGLYYTPFLEGVLEITYHTTSRRQKNRARTYIPRALCMSTYVYVCSCSRFTGC